MLRRTRPLRQGQGCAPTGGQRAAPSNSTFGVLHFPCPAQGEITAEPGGTKARLLVMEARRRSSALEVQSTCHCWARLCCAARHDLLGLSLRVRRQPQDGHVSRTATKKPEVLKLSSPEVPPLAPTHRWLRVPQQLMLCACNCSLFIHQQVLAMGTLPSRQTHRHRMVRHRLKLNPAASNRQP
jgi:hypothetical protein